MEKFKTADRGNGLRAVVPLRPGELLFRSDPLAYTVCKGSRGIVCDRCLLGYVRSPNPGCMALRVAMDLSGPALWGACSTPGCSRIWGEPVVQMKEKRWAVDNFAREQNIRILCNELHRSWKSEVARVGGCGKEQGCVRQVRN